PGRFVLCWIPALADLAAFCVERYRIQDPFRWRPHPVLPILDYGRDPIAGQIYRRRLTGRLRWTAGAATATAALRVKRQRARDHCAHCEQQDSIHATRQSSIVNRQLHWLLGPR